MKTPLERAITRVQQQYKRNPEAVQLAKLASLAVRVEPHLLRRLRLELLPDADVGIEADLWFGPLVESRGVRAIVLNRYVVELLREKLAEGARKRTRDRQLLRRVIALTKQAHAKAATTIRLEERLTALAILNKPNASQKIDEALRPALRTMQAGGEDARQLAQWAMRALSQAHRSVRESRNAIALGLSATLALGGRRILRDVVKLPGDLGDMTWLLQGAISVPPTRIGVELVADGVAFAEPGGGQPQLKLPATNPLVLSLAWKTDGGDAQMLVEAVPGRTVELDAGVTHVELRTLRGDEYLLSAVSPVESSPEATSEDLGASHFDNHVFISYAHLDNEQAEENDPGWVDRFHKSLKAFLSSAIGEEAVIWRDPKLRRADVFVEEIVSQFQKTALLVSILSPRYLKSEWCIREVNEFCRVAEQTGGVLVDNKSRVLKVIKTPIDPELTQRLPPSLRDTLGYTFYQEVEGGGFRTLDPRFGDEFKARFNREVALLADEVAKMLSRLAAGERLLAKQADEIYASFGDGVDAKGESARQKVVRQIFLRVVDLAGQGADEGAWRPVRRRVPKAIFSSAQEQEILRALIDQKLLVSSGGRQGGEVTIEVAHEALFTSWERLKGWIAGGKQVIFARNRLADDARHWHSRRKEDEAGAEEELLSGSRLAQALEMRARGDFDTLFGGLSVTETEFLDASAAFRDRREQKEQERKQRELAQAQALATEQKKRADDQAKIPRREEPEQQRLADYTRVIEQLPGAPVEQVAAALNNRGIIWSQKGEAEKALVDYTRVIEQLPGAPVEQVAAALNNRGIIWSQKGEAEKALVDYTRVIELPGAPVEQVAVALNNRGVTWGQKGETEKALLDYMRVIEQLPGAPVEQVAAALNNRGTVLKELGTRSSGEQGARYLEQSVAAYRAALEVYTREQLPQQWATTQNNLGLVLSDLGERASGEQSAQYLEQSVAAYRVALEVRTREQLPQDWAMTQNNLGNAFKELGTRSSGEQRARYLQEAIAAYENALSITPEADPYRSEIVRSLEAARRENKVASSKNPR